MLDYQGWIIIQDDPTEEMPEGKSFDSRVKEIVERIDLLRAEYDAAISHYGINGHRRIMLCGASNRKDFLFCEVIRLYECVASLLPGSHGILYYLDTEDQQYYDAYRCLILRMGRVTTEMDNFFSPVSEKVDGEDTGFSDRPDFTIATN